MFLTGAVTYIAGLIYSQNFTKAETLAWVVPNILIYVLFSVFLLMFLPFELMVGCCIGLNPKSPASDYTQRRRKITNQWAKKHQASMVVHKPIIRNVSPEVVEVKAQIRATKPPKMTGIYKEMTKPVTLTEKGLRESYLGIVNSTENFHTPKGSQKGSGFDGVEYLMKSQFTPENWKKTHELGRARDGQGHYKGLDPAKNKNRDLSRSIFRLAEEDVMMRAKALPNIKQSPSKSYVSNTQLAKGYESYNFHNPGFKEEMVRSHLGEEFGYKTALQNHRSEMQGAENHRSEMQGAQNYRSEMQWPHSGGVKETEGVNARPIGNHRQEPMPN
jgi:hypothetical protein